MNTQTETNNAFDEALKIQDEKVARGKDIICHIAMTTSNNFEIVDSLMELMEMFVIYDSNIMIGDIAEELQRYLYTWTREHGDAFSNWKESVLTGKKYETPESVEITNQTEPYVMNALFSGLLVNPETPPIVGKAITEHFAALHTKQSETDTSKDAESSSLETPTDTAKQIADLLNNPNLPHRLADAVHEGLTDLYNNDLDKEKLSDHLTSAEYIAKLLSMTK